MKKFGIIILLVFISFFFFWVCGYTVLQYELSPSEKIIFEVPKDKYDDINKPIIILSSRYKAKVQESKLNHRVPYYRSVTFANKNFYVKSYMYIYPDKDQLVILNVSLQKSIIPGLRPSEARTQAMKQDFIDTLTAIEGVRFKEVQYLKRESD
ncbi:MAG: hypothetical protein JKY46_09010 [Robiginitomaculum sp.]|nr:hypothetical protein [Robiginitomaculum sp.]